MSVWGLSVCTCSGCCRLLTYTAGFLVVMPDFFGSRVWDDETFPPDFQSDKWKTFYAFCGDFEIHRPKARNAVALLRHLGCTKVSTMGLCWGSQLAFDMSAEGLTDAAATAHPSLLTADAVRAAKHPVCLLLSKDEPPFEDIEAAVRANTHGRCVYTRYAHLDHGFFGCRFDHDSCTDVQRKELDEATAASIAFFRSTLQ